MQLYTLIASWLIFESVIKFAYSAKILCIFPTPYHSHQTVFQVLTGELARQGHELVVMTPQPRKNPKANITEIDVSELSAKILKKIFLNNMRNKDRISLDNSEFWSFRFPFVQSLLNEQLGSRQMQDLLNDKTQKFDLILLEGSMSLGLMVTARFKAPVISVTTFIGLRENFVSIGTETNFLMYPDYTVQNILTESLWDKVVETIRYLTLQWRIYSNKHKDDLIIKKHFGESAMTLNEMQGIVDMLFLNIPYLWDHNRPTTPSVVYMGALQLKDPARLPVELQNYLDKSKNGVIYFSLGTKFAISDLPKRTVDVILKVFGSLPYNVILKCKESYIPNKPNNVRLEKWLPQHDMLHHPKIKSFITHGGLQSTHEAIAAKVPLIGLPIASDQWYNVQMYRKFEIGIQLDIDRLDEKEFRDAIIHVAEDKRVPNAPKSCIAEIFSADASTGSPVKNGNLRPRTVRDTPTRPRDTHSRLFGQTASAHVTPMVTDTIRSNIKFGEAMMNGGSPAHSPKPLANGSASSTPSRGETDAGEHSTFSPPKRNPVTGDGVALQPQRRRHPAAGLRGAEPHDPYLLEPQPSHRYYTSEWPPKPADYYVNSTSKPSFNYRQTPYTLLGLASDDPEMEHPIINPDSLSPQLVLDRHWPPFPAQHYLEPSEKKTPYHPLPPYAFVGMTSALGERPQPDYKYNPVPTLGGLIDPYIHAQADPPPTLFRYERDGPIPDFAPLETPTPPGPYTLTGFPPIFHKHVPGYLFDLNRHAEDFRPKTYYVDYVRRRQMEGNPITGVGYKSLNGQINTVTSVNGNSNMIAHNRVPPGGYSSGLW